MSFRGSWAPCFTHGALSASASLPRASVAQGCESQPCCPVLGGGRTARSSPGLAQHSHGGGLEPRSCPLPGRRPAPLKPQTLAKLLLSSQCSGLPRSPVRWLSICPSAGGRREVLPCASHALHSAGPSPPHRPGTQSPFCLPCSPPPTPRALIWALSLCPALGAPLLFGPVPGCHHCLLRSARMDGGVGFWALASWCQAFGAKACEGPWLAL